MYSLLGTAGDIHRIWYGYTDPEEFKVVGNDSVSENEGTQYDQKKYLNSMYNKESLECVVEYYDPEAQQNAIDLFNNFVILHNDHFSSKLRLRSLEKFEEDQILDQKIDPSADQQISIDKSQKSNEVKASKVQNQAKLSQNTSRSNQLQLLSQSMKSQQSSGVISQAHPQSQPYMQQITSQAYCQESNQNHYQQEDVMLYESQDQVMIEDNEEIASSNSCLIQNQQQPMKEKQAHVQSQEQIQLDNHQKSQNVIQSQQKNCQDKKADEKICLSIAGFDEIVLQQVFFFTVNQLSFFQDGEIYVLIEKNQQRGSYSPPTAYKKAERINKQVSLSTQKRSLIEQASEKISQAIRKVTIDLKDCQIFSKSQRDLKSLIYFGQFRNKSQDKYTECTNTNNLLDDFYQTTQIEDFEKVEASIADEHYFSPVQQEFEELQVQEYNDDFDIKLLKDEQINSSEIKGLKIEMEGKVPSDEECEELQKQDLNVMTMSQRYQTVKKQNQFTQYPKTPICSNSAYPSGINSSKDLSKYSEIKSRNGVTIDSVQEKKIFSPKIGEIKFRNQDEDGKVISDTGGVSPFHLYNDQDIIEITNKHVKPFYSVADSSENTTATNKHLNRKYSQNKIQDFMSASLNLQPVPLKFSILDLNHLKSTQFLTFYENYKTQQSYIIKIEQTIQPLKSKINKMNNKKMFNQRSIQKIAKKTYEQLQSPIKTEGMSQTQGQTIYDRVYGDVQKKKVMKDKFMISSSNINTQVSNPKDLQQNGVTTTTTTLSSIQIQSSRSSRKQSQQASHLESSNRIKESPYNPKRGLSKVQVADFLNKFKSMNTQNHSQLENNDYQSSQQLQAESQFNGNQEQQNTFGQQESPRIRKMREQVAEVLNSPEYVSKREASSRKSSQNKLSSVVNRLNQDSAARQRKQQYLQQYQGLSPDEISELNQRKTNQGFKHLKQRYMHQSKSSNSLSQFYSQNPSDNRSLNIESKIQNNNAYVTNQLPFTFTFTNGNACINQEQNSQNRQVSSFKNTQSQYGLPIDSKITGIDALYNKRDRLESSDTSYKISTSINQFDNIVNNALREKSATEYIEIKHKQSKGSKNIQFNL
eukprot:403348198